MYRMCNGNDIWDEQLKQVNTNLMDAILNGKFPNRKLYLPHIPLALRKVINKCIEIDPDKRYNSVLEIINALSVIDNNLDWKYSKYSEMESWTRISAVGNHQEVIELCKSGNTYKITGKKINIESQNVTNVSKWTYSDSDKDKIIKKLLSFLKE